MSGLAALLARWLPAVRRWWPLLVLATALLVLRSLALFSDVEAIPGNSFATEECFAARVGSVQSGEVTSTGTGTTDVAISGVDPSASFVLHTVEASASDPGNALVAVTLEDATTVRVTRQTDDTVDLVVRWHVVEYDCGVRVQRGTSTGASASSDEITLATNVEVEHTFATVDVVPSASATALLARHHVTASLVDGGTLRLESGGGGRSFDEEWAWQVVEFTDGDATVHTATASMASGELTATAVVPAVDRGRTLLLGDLIGDGTTAARNARAELTDDTTVTFTRETTGSSVELLAVVIELADGTTVQSGELSTAPTTATATAAIPAVQVDRTTVLSTSSGFGGPPASASVAGFDDVADGVGRFTLDDPETVRVTRGSTTGTATWVYQAVTWGGPSWWDTDHANRQRLYVDTTSEAAPDDYSVPFTFDHEQMVLDGAALASGDDVRVLFHDGISWTELDRVLDDRSSWDEADTTVWFRARRPVAADSSDGSYWLYSANPTAGSPPEDPSEVFTRSDDFEDGTDGAAPAGYSQRTTGSEWFAADPWSTRTSLTIPAGAVGQDLADFPVLVDVTIPALSAAQTDGDDLRFTAADGTAPLSHEIEAFDAATGALRAWVELPLVTTASDTDLFVFAGSSTAPDMSDVRGTWSNGYDGVWHLDEDPNGGLPHADDASPYGRDGVATGTLTATANDVGRIGDGVRFAGDDGRVDVGTLDVRTDDLLTLSTWVDPDTAGGAIVVRAHEGADDHLTLRLLDNGDGTSRALLNLRDEAGSDVDVQGGVITPGTAAHVAATWDGATIVLYVDGAQVATTPLAGRDEVVDVPLSLAAGPSGASPFDGVLDEVRLQTAARSQLWLAAEVANQADPSTFVSVGPTDAGSFFDPGGWTARKPLTIGADNVDDDLTDYPLLVQLDSDAQLAAEGNADASDLVFTAEDGSTRLDHEIESWDPATGELTAWVRVPELSSSVDTGLFLYYGNATAEDLSDPAEVWRNGYEAVYHLADDPQATGP